MEDERWYYLLDDLNRFLTAPATPKRPVPKSTILAGSGTAFEVI
jgi:hypothetical protein